MINNNIIHVVSHFHFNEYCEENNINDMNVETDNSDKAFISIVGTKDCTEALGIEENEHWFKEEHSNVLNLDFDDTVKDMVNNGVNIKAMSEEQAKKTVEFIENNLGKEFFCHCLAGISRSRGVASFIEENYKEQNYSVEDCGYTRPNRDVIAKLNKVLWERNGKLED